ncbi:MAG: type II CRISPR RNA-guided endonuclease Cas9 [Candidatus Nanopelagicales bacterium]|nr:type II CRISPR RNA-guided endonuclease Cas9 [Candidatus Nanopelagicales bacterium]
MAMQYRLALDLGTSSIGWAMLRLSYDGNKPARPVAIIRTGVRIFGDGRDPKSGSSLAVNRREARGMRRNRDRKLKRKQRLLDTLIDAGFLPQDVIERRNLSNLDPFQLRSRGLSQRLEPYEFGRALLHINQRRGFKSNRKTDGGDADGSLMKGTIERLKDQLAADGYRTVGQWLAERHENRESVRARLRGSTVKDKAYDLYFDRSMIEHEFEELWKSQSTFDPSTFSQEKHDAIFEAMFFQRNLRPVRPGRCTLEPDRDRGPKALPSSQLFRIYQEVNNLGIDTGAFSYRPLTLEERNLVVDRMNSHKAVTFEAIRKLLKLSGKPRFNLESEKRKDLKGNVTAVTLSKPEAFGDRWETFTLDQQDEIATHVLETESEEKLMAWLKESFGVSEENAQVISDSRGEITKQSQGYSNLSTAAIYKILPHMQAHVIKYSQAVTEAGYGSHSALTHMEQTGEILQKLPYYGEYLQRHVGHGTGEMDDLPADRFGRIANPTVHIALNEVAKLVNALIKRYGPPTEVTIEIARELKKTRDQKIEDTKRQAENQAANERMRAQIYELTGITATRADLQKMKLWIELDKKDPANRRCIYTGEMISIQRLFSPEVEVEHILPFSRTLDDSLNNKTVSLVRANRDKGNRTPFEAFGDSPEGYDYEGILERAKATDVNRGKRFGPDAYEKWLSKDADFLARALNDTKYLSRIAKEYLQLITPTPVTVVPGRMTASLRRHWGLNNLLSEDGEKNRLDHRHHAVDAIVIGLMDRASLQRYATAQGRGVDIKDQLEDKAHIEPLENLREKAQASVNAIVVSHRPNHGYQRQMNNDTNYGLRPNGYVATRYPLDEFKTVAAIEKAQFADPYLKNELLNFVGDATPEQLKSLIAEFTQVNRTRKARLWQKLDVIPIPINPDADYRAPKGIKAREDSAVRGVKGDSNYCLEIHINEKGKWVGEVISTFEAYRVIRTLGEVEGTKRLRDPKLTQSGNPLILRLTRNDVVEIDVDGPEDRRLMRVCKFDSSGRFFLADLKESNVDARVRVGELAYLSATAGTLQNRNAKAAAVSPDGRVSIRKLT